MHREYILGVDAGGTKTTAAVASIGPEDEVKILSRYTTGAGNPKRAGADIAYQNVFDAIESAARDANVAIADIRAAVVGMAGAGTLAAQADAVGFVAQRSEIQRLDVVPDYQLVLPAAFPSDGVAVIAGTGSIAHAVHGDREARVGGHGYLIDDAGSGFWIGQQALRAVVRELDGRGPATAMTRLVCDDFGVTNSQELVSVVHSTNEQIEKIASVAPLVLAAESNDEVARSILDQAAKELGKLVAAARQSVGINGGYSLAVAGSVLTKTAVVRDGLQLALEVAGLKPDTVKCVAEPVDGAIQLALKRLRE